MQALISLYHQSADWVTPENLDEYIDAVFTPSTKDISIVDDYQTKKHFKHVLAERRRLSKFGGNHNQNASTYLMAFNPANSSSLNPIWLDQSMQRKSEESAALWGFDRDTKKLTLDGLCSPIRRNHSQDKRGGEKAEKAS